MEKKNNKVLIIILVVIILCLLGFIVYDKFIKKAPEIKEKECQICEICQECEKCEVCQECEKCDDNKIECNCPASSVLGLKVSSVKKVTIQKRIRLLKLVIKNIN